MKFFQDVSYKQGVGAQLRDLLATTKVVVLSGYRGDDLLGFYDRLSDELGTWIPMEEDLESGRKTGAKWIEIRYDPQFPMSYRHSSTRQPLHTDGSYESRAPEISLFYCIKAAPIGGATTFVDSDDLLKSLECYSPRLFRACCDIPVTFAKGDDAKTRPIISTDGAGTVLTWNYFRVVENSPEVGDLKQEFHRFLEEKIVEGGLCFSCPLDAGDAVFFNDERVLHGRNSFIANGVGERHLNKCGIYLRKR